MQLINFIAQNFAECVANFNKNQWKTCREYAFANLKQSDWKFNKNLEGESFQLQIFHSDKTSR